MRAEAAEVLMIHRPPNEAEVQFALQSYGEGLVVYPFPFHNDEPEWRFVLDHYTQPIGGVFVGILLPNHFLYANVPACTMATERMREEAYLVWRAVVDLHRREP